MVLKLGHLLSRPLQPLYQNLWHCCQLFHMLSCTKKEGSDLEQFWSLESMVISTPAEKDDMMCSLKIISAHVHQLQGTWIGAKMQISSEGRCPITSLELHLMCKTCTSHGPLLLWHYISLKPMEESSTTMKDKVSCKKVEEVDPTDRMHYIPHPVSHHVYTCQSCLWL